MQPISKIRPTIRLFAQIAVAVSAATLLNFAPAYAQTQTQAPEQSGGLIEPEAPRLSAGEKRRMTASITDIITSQMIDKKCWADHSDMAGAKRLRATYRVWFGRNGKFSKPPELVEPSRKPANDPPLNTFVIHAERALNKCNQIGWFVPEDYFRLPQPAYIDVEFLPKIGANQ